MAAMVWALWVANCGKNCVGPREQRPRRGKIGDVGIHLAGEHRVAGETCFLRPFDLAVPIGALDQTHRDAAASGRSHLRQPIDQRERALAIGLHREPKSVPAGKRRIGEQRLDKRKAQLELVLLLGVDGERQPRLAHGERKLAQRRQQFLPQPHFLCRLIARMQRRQLHRQPGPRVQLLLVAQMRRARPGGDGFHRLVIARGITLRVVGGARSLPQHVEREAIALLRLVLGIGKRLLDGLAEHELAAENAHGLAERLADHRFAASPDQALDHAGWRVALALAPIDDAPRQHQPIGGGIDQQRVGLAEMPPPIAAADGSGDQPVRRGGVGNAQQRFGEAEQQHALAARQPIFMQEGIDAASLVPPCPSREHKLFGELRDLALLLLAASGAAR